MINLIKKLLERLEEFKYSPSLIVTNSEKYTYGVNYINNEINQRISVAYYDKNPLTDSKNEIALFIRIFKNQDYIDLSRLAELENLFLDINKGQYFIFKNEEKIIEDIFSYLYSKKDILLGENWIQIDYNIKDDY